MLALLEGDEDFISLEVDHFDLHLLSGDSLHRDDTPRFKLRRESGGKDVKPHLHCLSEVIIVDEIRHAFKHICNLS